MVICSIEKSAPPEQYEEEDPVISEGKDLAHPVMLQTQGSSKWTAFLAPEQNVNVQFRPLKISHFFNR